MTKSQFKQLVSANCKEIRKIASRPITFRILTEDAEFETAVRNFLDPASLGGLSNGKIIKVSRDEDWSKTDIGFTDPEISDHDFLFDFKNPEESARRLVDEQKDDLLSLFGQFFMADGKSKPISAAIENLQAASEEKTLLPLAASFRGFRGPVSERLIWKVAEQNALFAMVSSLPNVFPSLLVFPWAFGEFAADTMVLTANQIRLSCMLAAVHGNEPRHDIKTFWIIASAFGWRALARQLVSRVPAGAGLVWKGAVAFAGTYAVGRALDHWHRTGRPMDAAAMRESYNGAYSKGRETIEQIVRDLNLRDRFDKSRGGIAQRIKRIWRRVRPEPQRTECLQVPGPAASLARPTKVCVVLLQLGGPDSLDDVQPFLERMFGDRELFNLPVPEICRKWIVRRLAAWRARKARPLYESIGGRSPIGDTTRRQAELLRDMLLPELDCEVTVAMRYGRPTTDEAIQAVREAGCDHLLLLPLYPHYSVATTGSSTLEWERRCHSTGLSLPTEKIDCYYKHPKYIDAVTQRIQEAKSRLPEGTRPHLVFSAHGLPRKFIEQGDPYQRQIEECVQTVMDRMPPNSPYTICYQSRIGPQRWLGPSLPATLKKLGRSGTSAVVVVPISFVSDHLETLSEINIEARKDAERWGIRHFETTEGLNDSPLFIEALAELVIGATIGSHQG